MSETFEGFKRSTFQFLKELKSNNNREWFNKNKARYENDVLETSLQFIAAMQPRLKKVSPYFTAIPKRTGGSLMRIYRDTRFAKDKTPYKTNIGIQFRHEFGKDVHAPGFYVHIEPSEIFFGAGIWRPENKTLKKIRTHIVEYEKNWKRIAHGKRLKEHFETIGSSLKRPPRDFDPEHPFIDDLKRKDFIVVSGIARNQANSDELLSVVHSLMRSSLPFVRFLCDGLRIPS